MLCCVPDSECLSWAKGETVSLIAFWLPLREDFNCFLKVMKSLTSCGMALINLNVLIGLIPISSIKKYALRVNSSLGSLLFMAFGLLPEHSLETRLVCHC